MTEYTDNLNAAIDKLEVELAHQHDLVDAMEKDNERLEKEVERLQGELNNQELWRENHD